MNNLTNNKTLKTVKIIIWLIPLILLVIIIAKYFAPFGTLAITYKIPTGSKMVTNFASKEKYELIGTTDQSDRTEYYQAITNSPLYFDVHHLRDWQKATVTLVYQNPNAQYNIKLAVKQPNDAYYYRDMAFYHRLLETLPAYWELIEKKGDIMLWQRNKSWSSLEKEKLIRQEKMDENVNDLKIDLQGMIISEDEYLAQIKKYEEALKNEINKLEQEYAPDQLSYSEINDFLNNLPNPSSVAFFNYDLSPLARESIPGYQAKQDFIEINKSLRGSQDIYTYLGEGEQLDFRFLIQDINRHLGKDDVKVSLYKGSQKIKEMELVDDGEENATGKVSKEELIELASDRLNQGIYRIKIDCNDDIFIKNIKTRQKLFVFDSIIYTTDNEEYREILGNKTLTATTLYTTASAVTFRTAHSNGLQTVLINGEKLEITRRHQSYEFENLSGISQIYLPKNDIYLEGVGVFAFSQEQLFDPFSPLYNPTDLTRIANSQMLDQFDYVIADYPVQAKEGDWLVSSATVEQPYLYTDDHTVHFIITLPGLSENRRVLLVKELKIVLEKDPLNISNIFSRLNNWLNNIF